MKLEIGLKALGVRLWACKKYHNLPLPLPWWDRKPAVGEKPCTAGEERGISCHPPLCPLPSSVFAKATT